MKRKSESKRIGVVWTEELKGEILANILNFIETQFNAAKRNIKYNIPIIITETVYKNVYNEFIKYPNKDGAGYVNCEDGMKVILNRTSEGDYVVYKKINGLFSAMTDKHFKCFKKSEYKKAKEYAVKIAKGE